MSGPGQRFPGFDVLSQSGNWDPVTARVVLARVGPAGDLRFFTPAEGQAAAALLDRLLGQADGPGVPLVGLVDARLSEGRTDGWRYDDMPEDGRAWRDSLSFLDADALAGVGLGFAACPAADQEALIQAIRDLGPADWHGMAAGHIWSLWTRYACTAFYSHPSAWNEIGFPGPAYPRGYKNAGVDRREPFEVRDARPSDDPVPEGA
ncbi:MAG: gluconate 2-dehydrogenase subunit 3 family protein [Actinomycetia bacterium]|nr:gluconate 2-dehydrogenase subunit 3 family protein [Actinomycetes bacterium]